MLIFATGFFGDEDSPGTMLAWLMVPIVSTFLGWLCVRQADPLLRIYVWFFVLACLFFCWIAIFSFGIFFLPAPILLIFAALGPWDGETVDGSNSKERGATGPAAEPAETDVVLRETDPPER